MNVKELDGLLLNSLESIYNINIKSLLSSEILLKNIKSYNCILLFLQDKYATDIRSEYFWINSGRRVKDNAFKLNVIYREERSKYINASTKESVDIGQIMPKEFKDALRYGIIEKVIKEKALKVHTVYDIRDTITYDKELYQGYLNSNNINEIKLSKMIKYIEQETDKKAIEDEETALGDLFTIGNEEAGIKILKLIDITSRVVTELHTDKGETLAEFIGKSIKFILESNSDCNEHQSGEIIEQLAKEVYDKYGDDLSILKNTLELIINIAKNIVNDNDDYTYIEDDYILIKKAERLLNIAEANSTLNSMRGGKTIEY